MSTSHSPTHRSECLRVRAWHVDASAAYLSLVGPTARPTVTELAECLDALRDRGFTSVVTSALHHDEVGPFLRLGFTEFDRLTILRHDLQPLPSPPPAPDHLRLRRARGSDRPTALEIDRAAFPAAWQLDMRGLAEALAATPRRRFRLAELGREPVGYAVTGRAGPQGFLQRLAVDPARHGHGIGAMLVVDALHWAARRGVARVLVNTQTDNRRALDLYRRLGFETTPSDLVVLRRALS